MGMYTEVFFRAEISAWAAETIHGFRINWPHCAIPDHPFFTKDRANMVLGGGSAYFPGESHFKWTLGSEDSYVKFCGDPDNWAIVEFRSSLKNYDGEIESFFDWVTPYVRDGGGGGSRDMIGYSLYEEADSPTIYYARED